jgi:UDP-N-acetylmuramyl pentapeptide phosphotransferase/UDP-N-acetylglucosamine-1-phosphate transferase
LQHGFFNEIPVPYYPTSDLARVDTFMIDLEASRAALIIVVLIAAALMCAGLVKLLLPLLCRYALARPNARSSHIEPTPQGAGVAVIAASLLTAAAAATSIGLAIPFPLFGAALFIAFVGFVDDIRSIPVLPRLLLQAAAVGAILFWAPADLRIVPSLPLGTERGLILLAGVWFINLVNFMDGLDLMTVAEVVPIAGTMILLGSLNEYPTLATFIAAALCGAMIGFAPYNRPVARVFLGDVGSLPIGLLLGWCLLQLAWHGQLTAALLMPLYYLADATLTLLRRIARRESFWAAHRSHFYQRATNNGHSVSRVVGEVFVLNLGLAALAIVSIHASSRIFDILSLLAAAIAVASVLYRFSRVRSV